MSLKPLTPHQREVFGRIAFMTDIDRRSSRESAPSQFIGCKGACFHLVTKGYITATPVYGPRGGTTWEYRLTPAARDWYRDRIRMGEFHERA